MLDYTENRILVPTDEDRGVIPDEWLADYGRVLLPEVWDYESWFGLSKQDRRVVYRSVADLAYWFWNIYFPHKSRMELGYSKERVDAIYPDGPPAFWMRYLRDLQAAVPLELLASEKKPEHNPIWRLARSEPAGHFKSCRTCEAFPLWLIGNNPSVTILIVVETKDKGDRFIESHKDHIERNERFVGLHGKLRTESSEGIWRTTGFVVDRPLKRSAPTVEIIGYRGAIQGERYDIGLGDDMASIENSNTDYARDLMWNRLTRVILRRLNADRRMFCYIGTPNWGGDLLDRMKQDARAKGTWDYKETPAILSGTWPPPRPNPDEPYTMENVSIPDDLRVLWPQFWTPEKLVEDFVEDAEAFARTRMLLHQDPESAWFSDQLIEDCKADGGVTSDGRVKPLLSRWPEDVGIPDEGSGLYSMYTSFGFNPQECRRVISVDLGVEEKVAKRGGADSTVFQLWGYFKPSHARILLNQRRFTTSDPREIERVLVSWVSAYSPHVVCVEAVAVDKLYARSLKDVIGQPVKIKDVKSDKQDDILSFKDLIQSGFCWVPFAEDTFKGNDARNYNTRYVMRQFLKELREWPFGEHDDTLMAAVHAATEMRGKGGEIRAQVVGRDPLQHLSVRLARKANEEATTEKIKDQLAALRWRIDAAKKQMLFVRDHPEALEEE